MLPFSHEIMAFASMPYYQNLLFVPQSIDVISETADEPHPHMPKLRSPPPYYQRQTNSFLEYRKESEDLNYNHVEPVTSKRLQTLPQWLMPPEIEYTKPLAHTKHFKQYQPAEYKQSHNFQTEYIFNTKFNNTKETKPRRFMDVDNMYPVSLTPARRFPQNQPAGYKLTQPFQLEHKINAKFNNTKESKPRRFMPIKNTYPAPLTNTKRTQQHKQNQPSQHEYQVNSKFNITMDVTKEPRPTIVPLSSELFNPLQDAKALFRALKGSKVEGTKIIDLLTKRSNEQRLQIAARYKHFYDVDLKNVVRSKTKGKFKDVLLALLTPTFQFYAIELHRAIESTDTNEDIIIEILCTLSNDEIQMVKQMYYQTYIKHLEEDIRYGTSGNFQKLLLSLCAVNRSEDNTVNVKKAALQAKELVEAGEKRMETEELAFISVLCSQSFPQLTEVFKQYYAITEQNIEEAIKNEFVGVIKKALKAIVKAVHSKPLFFAERLYKSMSGLGTNNRQIIRIMITRSEIDLGDIEDVFFQLYHYSLENWIEEDCHGNFKKCLLAILGAY